jgi:tRNA-2-methylthio-N6-dimethylallyladenosine synthase
MRGSERSRPTKSILTETENLVANGVKEVFLIGQNVNSYQYNGTDFPALLDAVSGVSGVKRIRFTTSHPKNLSEKLVEVIRDRENVCSHIHLPLQSGSDRVLSAMGREYTVERYLSLISLLRREIPEVSITTDIISGYPGETVDDHQRTLDLVQTVEFDSAFTFKYSPRLNTPAFKLKDDVPEAEKIRRLNEISNLQRKITERKNKLFIGKTVTVLVEIASKRSDNDMLGRTDCGRNVIIHNQKLPIGTLCTANITAATSQTLLGAFQSILK